MPSIEIDNVCTLYEIWVCRGEHEIKPEIINSILNEMLKKAREIRSQSKEKGDKYIVASNRYIEQAEIITNLYHLARTATKKNKKLYRFSEGGDNA